MGSGYRHEHAAIGRGVAERGAAAGFGCEGNIKRNHRTAERVDAIFKDERETSVAMRFKPREQGSERSRVIGGAMALESMGPGRDDTRRSEWGLAICEKGEGSEESGKEDFDHWKSLPPGNAPVVQDSSTIGYLRLSRKCRPAALFESAAQCKMRR